MAIKDRCAWGLGPPALQKSGIMYSVTAHEIADRPNYIVLNKIDGCKHSRVSTTILYYGVSIAYVQLYKWNRIIVLFSSFKLTRVTA